MPVVYRNPLGRWVKRQRKKLGLSKRALAQKAGIGQYTVLRIEDDEWSGSPYYWTLVGLFQVLGPPPKSVLRGLSPDERAKVAAAVRSAEGGEE